MRSTYKVASQRRRKKLLKRTKGFAKARQIRRKAKETLAKGGQYAYQGRKQRKRDFRRLWITRLSAAAKTYGLNYSVFISKLKKKNILLNRKILSEIAVVDPSTFEKIMKEID